MREVEKAGGNTPADPVDADPAVNLREKTQRASKVIGTEHVQSAKSLAQNKLEEMVADLAQRESALAEREAVLAKEREDIEQTVKQRVAQALENEKPEPKKREKITHLNILPAAFGPADGYGNSAEQICLALERKKVSFSISGAPRRTGASNAEHLLAREHKLGEAILFYAPPTHFMKQYNGRPAIGFSMYEADELPEAWRPTLVRVDEIWVPSEWNAEVFGKYTDRKVSIVPLGVDAQAFAAAPRQRGAKLRFLHHSAYANEYRKGVDLAMNAFTTAFPDRNDVELVIHSAFASDIVRKDPRISVLIRRFTTADLAAYYREFDALIYPSRGEGFGLVPLEAMATGMPAIFPKSSGMLSYAHLGLTVGTRPAPARAVDAPASARWYEPSFDEVVDRLREVDEAYSDVQARAMEHAAAIASDFTWDRTAARICELLDL